MKITIDINDASSYSLTPYSVYRALYMEYWEQEQKKHGKTFWGMATACDSVARDLYAQVTGRSRNVKNLILTYSDAEKVFELFKQFADVWIANH